MLEMTLKPYSFWCADKYALAAHVRCRTPNYARAQLTLSHSCKVSVSLWYVCEAYLEAPSRYMYQAQQSDIYCDFSL